MSCRILGQVHLVRGEREPAETALCQSLQILSDLNSEYEAAKPRLSLARLTVEAGSTEERQAHLAQAIETFDELGAQAGLAEVRDLGWQLW